MGQKVFVYSIPTTKETGLSTWVNPTNSKPLNKNKMRGAKTRIAALYSPEIGGLANYISYNYATDPETGSTMLDEKGNPVTLQVYLEKKYRKPAGFYNNMAPYKDQKLDELTFYQTATWTLEDGATMFDLGTEMGELGYYMCLASNIVANSEREWLEHRWPKAEFYIAVANESAEIKYSKIKARKKAFAALEDRSFTDTYKQKIAVLLGLVKSTSPYVLEDIEVKLYDFIDQSSNAAGSSIEKFMDLFKLLATAQGRELLEAKFLLQRAIDTRVIYEKQDTYTWVRTKGNIVIGERYSDAIDYLLSPKKSAEREEIESDVTKKQL